MQFMHEHETIDMYTENISKTLFFFHLILVNTKLRHSRPFLPRQFTTFITDYDDFLGWFWRILWHCSRFNAEPFSSGLQGEFCATVEAITSSLGVLGNEGQEGNV